MTKHVRPRQGPQNPFALKFTDEPAGPENPFRAPVGPPDLTPAATVAVAEPPVAEPPVAEPPTVSRPKGLKATTEAIARRVAAKRPTAPRGPEPELPVAAPIEARPRRVADIDLTQPTDVSFGQLLAEIRAKRDTPTDIAEAAARPAARGATATQLEDERRLTAGGAPAEELGVGRYAVKPLTAGVGRIPGAGRGPVRPARILREPAEPGDLKQGIADFVNTAREHVYDQRALPSPRRKRDLQLTRDEGGTLVLEPEDMQDLEVGMGEMLGSLVDIPTLAAFVGGMKVAEGAIKLAAKKGVPLAVQWVRASVAPKTAPLAERIMANVVQGVGTGGTGAVTATTVQTLGEERRLPTPGEVGGSFAIGTVILPAFGAAMPVVGDMTRRLVMMAARPGTRNLGARLAQAARDAAKARRGPPPKDEEVFVDWWLGTVEDELGFARRVLGVKRDATQAEISSAYFKASRRYHPEGQTPDAELFTIYREAAEIARVGAMEPNIPPINRGLRIPAEPPAEAAEPPTGEAPVAPRQPPAGPAEPPARAEAGPGRATVAPRPQEAAARPRNPFKPAVAGGRTTPWQDAEGQWQLPDGPPDALGFYLERFDRLTFDPKKMQFRLLGEKGVDDRLDKVQVWDDEGEAISVWLDPEDGKLYVVNGHHRYKAAERLGVKELNVSYLDANTAEEAIVSGALQNIKQGLADPLDVARFLIHTGSTIEDLTARGIPDNPVMKKGRHLAQLVPDVFEAVLTLKLTKEEGIMIGEMIPGDEVLQRQALKKLGGRDMALVKAREIVRIIRAAGTERVAQDDLFGTEAVESLDEEKADVAVAIRRRMSQDKRDFGALLIAGRAERLTEAGVVAGVDEEAARGIAGASAQATEIFTRLYTRTGRVAELVTEAARRVKNGEKVGDVIDDTYESVLAAVKEEAEQAITGRGGEERPESGRPAPVEAGVDEAVGPTDLGPAEPAAPEPTAVEAGGAPEEGEEFLAGRTIDQQEALVDEYNAVVLRLKEAIGEGDKPVEFAVSDKLAARFEPQLNVDTGEIAFYGITWFNRVGRIPASEQEAAGVPTSTNIADTVVGAAKALAMVRGITPQEGAVEQITGGRKPPHEMTFKEYVEAYPEESLEIPRGSPLEQDLGAITADELVDKYGLEQLQILARFHGVSKSGAKKEIARRLKERHEVVEELRTATQSSLSLLKTASLREVVKRTGEKAQGNKQNLVDKLLRFVAKSEQEYQERVRRARHMGLIGEAQQRGETITDEVKRDRPGLFPKEELPPPLPPTTTYAPDKAALARAAAVRARQEAGEPSVGAEYTIMDRDARLIDQNTHEGVRYEFYETRDGGGIVRVVDVDTNEQVSVKHWPKAGEAQKAYDETVAKAAPEEEPPAVREKPSPYGGPKARGQLDLTDQKAVRAATGDELMRRREGLVEYFEGPEGETKAFTLAGKTGVERDVRIIDTELRRRTGQTYRRQVEAGAPADEAAVQVGLFGEPILTGREQTELLPEDAGKPTAKLKPGKIQPEEVARVRREGEEPEGERPAELFEEPAKPTEAELDEIRRKLEAGELDAAREQLDMLSPGAPEARQVAPTYQGSAAEFEKHANEFIGTGEGFQSFGWGHYLTDLKGIARDYQKRDVRRKSRSQAGLYAGMKVDGKYLSRMLDAAYEKQKASAFALRDALYGKPTLFERYYPKSKKAVAKETVTGGFRLITDRALREAARKVAPKETEQAVKDYKEYSAMQEVASQLDTAIGIGDEKTNPVEAAILALQTRGPTTTTPTGRTIGPGDRAYPDELAKNAIDYLRSHEIEIVPIPEGALYTVDLDVDETTLLDWDKTVAEQPDAVRKKLNKIIGDHADYLESAAPPGYNSLVPNDDVFTVEEVYRAFAIEDGRQATSEMFAKAGIKGHRYLDQGSRGRPLKIRQLQQLRDEWAATKGLTEKERASALGKYDKDLQRLKDKGLTYNYVIYDASSMKITAVSEPESTHTFGSAKRAEEAAQLGLEANKVPTLEARLETMALEPKTWVDIKGKQIQSAQDAATILRPYRSPKTETFHVILTDDKGKILAHTMESSGAVDYVAFNEDWPRYVHDLAERAKKVGATRVVLAHNHPSGNAKHSKHDVQLTVGLLHTLNKQGVNLSFDTHYIIDHDQVSTIKLGAVSEGQIEVDTDFHKITPPKGVVDWTAAKGANIKSPTDAVRLVGAPVGRRVDVLYRDFEGRAIAVVPHTMSSMRSMNKWLAAEIRALGADGVLFVVDWKEPLDPRGTGPRTPGIYVSVLKAANKFAMSEVAGKVYDVLRVSATTGYYASAQEDGSLASPELQREAATRPGRRLAEEPPKYDVGGRPESEPPVPGSKEELLARLEELRAQQGLGPTERVLPGEGELRGSTTDRSGWYDPGQLPEVKKPPLKRLPRRAVRWAATAYQFYSEDLTQIVRDQGGKAGQELAERAERTTSKTKQLMGAWDAARAAAQKLVSFGRKAERAVSWLQHQTPGKHPAAVYSRIQQAVEGKELDAEMPAHVRKVVEKIRTVNELTGKEFERIGLLQLRKEVADDPQLRIELERILSGEGGAEEEVFRPFTRAPDGKVFLRLSTSHLSELYRQPSTDLSRNPIYDQYIEMIAAENDLEIDEVGRIIESIRKQHFKRVGSEIPRVFENHPTDMWIDRPDGSRELIPLLWTHPYTYVGALVSSSAHRSAFVQEFGQSLTDNNLREAISRAVQARIDPNDVERLFRALAGISQGSPIAAPDAAERDMTNWFSHLMRFPRATMLTRAGVPNLFEVFGNIQAFGGGPTRFVRAMLQLWPTRYNALRETFARQGLVQSWVMHATMDRQRFMESLPRVYREWILRAFPTIPMWRIQEMQAAAMGMELAEGLRTGRSQGAVLEADRFVVRTILKFTQAQTEALISGKASDEDYLEVARRFTTRSNTTLLSLPAEESRAAGSRWFNEIFPFHRYSQMKIRSLVNAHKGFVREVSRYKADPTKQNFNRLAGATRTIALYHAGTTAAGSLTYLFLGLLAGGTAGVAVLLGDLKDRPGTFLRNAWIYAQMGPIWTSLARIWSDKRLDNFWMFSAPASVIKETVEALLGWANYQFLSPLDRAARVVSRVSPGPRAIHDLLVTFGLTATDPTRELAIRRYWQWIRDEQPPSARMQWLRAEADYREFRKHMGTAYLEMRKKTTAETVEAAREAIGRALAIEGKEPEDVMQSIRSRRFLPRIADDKKKELRTFLGPELYQAIQQHDAILDAWARAANPPRGGVPRRRRTKRTRR